jgi:hypothetical protein
VRAFVLIPPTYPRRWARIKRATFIECGRRADGAQFDYSFLTR